MSYNKKKQRWYKSKDCILWIKLTPSKKAPFFSICVHLNIYLYKILIIKNNNKF